MTQSEEEYQINQINDAVNQFRANGAAQITFPLEVALFLTQKSKQAIFDQKEVVDGEFKDNIIEFPKGGILTEKK